MGEQRIHEGNMLALIFLLLCVVILLAVAGRIWIDPSPLGSSAIDPVATDNPGESGTHKIVSDGGGPVA
ncbi:MAG: hypothetical protein OJF47_002503 [Nitrospira sp.]|jgi:hypothetical protein|nr:MAG: hypothetical protein OJF47_002503 [Nitrospira sp.]